MTITVPIHTVSEMNVREHWRVRNKRHQSHRMAVDAEILLALANKRTIPVEPPLLVTLTRIGKRILDDDNLQASFKHIRDCVAEWVGFDDGDVKRLRFKYRQEKGKDYSIRIDITSRKRKAVTV